MTEVVISALTVECVYVWKWVDYRTQISVNLSVKVAMYKLPRMEVKSTKEFIAECPMTTQCPAYSDIHSSTDIFRKVNTLEGGDSGGEDLNKWVEWLVLSSLYCVEKQYKTKKKSYM